MVIKKRSVSRILALTFMSGIMSMQIPTYGMQHYNKGLAEGKQQGINEERARGGLIIGGHVAAIANVTKHRDALANPNAALAAAGPADLTAILTTAEAVVGSAINGHPLVTNENKLDELVLLEAAAAPVNPLAPTPAEAADQAGKSGVRTALGLDPNPANFAATTAEVTRFIKLAKTELVKTPARKAAIAGHAAAIANVTKHRDALANPNAALAAAGPADLTAILTTAEAVVGSAINGHPLVTNENKLDELVLLEAAAAPVNPLAPTPAEAADQAGKSGVRTALGLDPNPANFAATTAEVTRFIKLAKTELVKTPARKAAIAGHAAAIANVTKHRDALANPNAALAAAGPADLTAILTTAEAVVGSAINGHPLVTNENKLDELVLLEAAAAPVNPLAPTPAEAADQAGKSGVRTALGLDPNPANFAATTAEVTRFIKLAKTELVKTPARKATIAGHAATIVELRKYATAIADPAAALVVGQPLQVVLAHQAGVGGSAAHGMGVGNALEMGAVIRTIESAVIHHAGGGGNALDDAAKSAVRTALGIDPTPANFVVSRPQVLAFVNLADLPDIRGKLAGLLGPNASVYASIEHIRTHLQPVQFRSDNGNAVAAGPLNETITAAFARLGL